MSATVQLIVVNYKTPRDLEDFIDSVENAVDFVDHVTYVANVQPEAEDLAVAATLDGARHFAFSENVGYARAVNYCASQETTPYIAIFNADVILSPHFIQKAISALEENPSWGVLGPRQVNERGELTAAGIFGTNDAPQHRGWLQQDNVRFHDVRDDVVTLAGSALVVKRACWDEMRNCPIFQEVFPGCPGALGVTPHYYEETVFHYHLRHHGWKAVYWGPLRVIHKWHTASPVGGWAEQQIEVSQEIFRNFCKRHDIPCD